MPPRGFRPEEFSETLNRVKESQDYGSTNPRPSFDPKLHREVVADALHGRKPESYRKALENHGFTYHPLVRKLDGTLEGQWRHPGLRFAFTEEAVAAEFKSPEDFDNWLRGMKAARMRYSR